MPLAERIAGGQDRTLTMGVTAGAKIPPEVRSDLVRVRPGRLSSSFPRTPNSAPRTPGTFFPLLQRMVRPRNAASGTKSAKNLSASASFALSAPARASRSSSLPPVLGLTDYQLAIADVLAARRWRNGARRSEAESAA